MFFRVLSLCLGVVSALGVTGPSALYQRLNGLTFNPPGYTIVMYQSCMQNQNAGNPCGSFTTYQSSNGVYTYQQYGPEAPVSPTCSRTFHLTLVCGATMVMSGVNENPTCVYSATLTLPDVCGIDLRVGNEAASVSGTVIPPTPSITLSTSSQPIPATSSSSMMPSVLSSISITSSGTISNTGSAAGTLSNTGSLTITLSGTISGTSIMSLSPNFTVTPTDTPPVTPTSLYAITMYPSATQTSSFTPTTTPLFMITAFPTVSPVNVTGGLAALLPGGATGTILGAVAVGLIGVALLGAAVVYFKKGGTLSGLKKKIEENKDAIKGAVDMLPLSEEQKAKLDKAIHDPTSVLPAQAQDAIQMVGKAQEYQNELVNTLPLTPTQKAALNTSIDSVKTTAIARLATTPAGRKVTSFIGKPSLASVVPEPVSNMSDSIATLRNVVEPKEQQTVEKSIDSAVLTSIIKEPDANDLEAKRTEVKEQEAIVNISEQNLVAVHINPEHLADFKEFLASKQKRQ